MAEYTKEDIIIFSDDERLKDAIGKECYFSNYPNYIITHINEDNCSLSKLKEIEIGYKYPFFNTEGRSYECIIIKKEEPKEYVPFMSAQEFFGIYNKVTNQNLIACSYEAKLSVHGIWLRCIIDDEVHPMVQVAEIWDDGLVLGNNDDTTRWAELLEYYQFLDGTPCGRKS